MAFQVQIEDTDNYEREDLHYQYDEIVRLHLKRNPRTKSVNSSYSTKFTGYEGTSRVQGDHFDNTEQVREQKKTCISLYNGGKVNALMKEYQEKRNKRPMEHDIPISHVNGKFEVIPPEPKAKKAKHDK